MVVKTAIPVKKASFWKGDGVKGEPRIVIDLSGQRVYFYKGDALVGESVISTGKKGFETPPGEYKVIQKDKDHASNLYGQFVSEDGGVVRSNVDVSKDKAGVIRTVPWSLGLYAGAGTMANTPPAAPSGLIVN